MQISLDEIISIKKIQPTKTIDITVSGDNLFFANDILTHNSGFNNSDIGLEDTSESFGLPATCDLMFALISNEELQGLNQVIVKQLKNRYNDPTYYKRFVLGIDRSRMKLYDVEESAQSGLTDSGQFKKDVPVFDKGSFSAGMKAENDYSGFKF